MKNSKGKVHKNEWTQEEYNALPFWAREIVSCIERTRQAAMYYRRMAIAFRTTLHDLCNTDANGLKFYDSVCKHEVKLFEKLEKIDTKEDAKLRNKLRAEVIRESKKLQKKGKK